MSLPENSDGTLLAVDVGMTAGLAWFSFAGRLLHSRSARFANRSVLKRALPGIFQEHPPVRFVVLEGMGQVADIWLHQVRRLDLPCQQVSAEVWRQDMLLQRERRCGQQAKLNAAKLAAPFAAQAGHLRPQSLGDDEAEAILCGLWAIQKLLPHLQHPRTLPN